MLWGPRGTRSVCVYGTENGGTRQCRQSRRSETRHALFELEVLVLHTGLVHLDAFDSDDALLWGEEVGVCWRIREEEPKVVSSF